MPPHRANRHRVNLLRAYVGATGGLLAAVALWGALAYGPPVPFLLAAAVGLGVAVAPAALARLKRLRERRRLAGLDGATFASPALDVDRETFLDRSATALDAAGAFAGVGRREFPEGTGLLVEHTRFHGTFVRLTDAGEAVVTGVRPEAVATVVDALEGAWDRQFVARDASPFLRPIPVRGVSRAFLALGLTVVVVADAAFVAGLAYPGDAYNPGEKTVLVGYDLAADLDPGTTETDARLGKAAFLVGVLREEATEIRWQAGIDPDERAAVDDADAISADVTRLLDAAAADDLTPAQRDRVAQLRAARDRALADARAAMAEAPPNGSASGTGSSGTPASLTGPESTTASGSLAAVDPSFRSGRIAALTRVNGAMLAPPRWNHQQSY